MAIREIHKYVQEVLNSNSKTIEYFEAVGDSNQQLKYRTANRLLKSWLKWKKSELSQVDFEIALRDYLIVFKVSIELIDYKPSDAFDRLGFSKNNGVGNNIWINLSTPKYVNAKFVTKVFAAKEESKKQNKQTVLLTNKFISQLTGFEEFKSEEQKLVVTGALRTPPGYTSLMSMSTGGGKSLITQSVAYQTNEGLTIVVVPTVSLMLDQVRNAKKIIGKRSEREIFCYYSGAETKELLKAICNKTARILFISPEAVIKNEKILSAIEKANQEKYLKNLIVDEAHIISEWGSSFRVDFQCIDALRKRFLVNNPQLRTFLLSATFSKRTVDLLRLAYSEGENWLEFRCDKLRTEIHFDVIHAKSYSEKKTRLLEMVPLLPHPMIIYVNRPDDAIELQKELSFSNIKNTRIFTGRTTSNEREKIIEEWSNDEFSIMIATCAFGVGVDKKDVRTVIHAYVPENPNKYYQEAGRGGRDGLPCLAVMLFTDADIDSAFSFTSKVLTVEKLTGRWFSMLNSPKTVRKVGGIIKIDTSIKPSYIESDEFDWANEADINWNVYVILLLRRAGLLEIVDVEYDRRYLFTVHLNKQNIANNTPETIEILEKVRANEWCETVKDFEKMANSLKRIGKACWSDMFNDVYNLTDEYCSGCNSHENVISNGTVGFALKKPVDLFYKESKEILFKRFFGESYVGICFTEKYNDCVKTLCKLGINTLVGFDNREISNLDNISYLTFWSINEFFNLIKMGNLYLNGYIAVKVPLQENELIRLIAITENETYMSKFKLVFVCDNNIYVRAKNKHLSEIVNGPCLRSDILEVQNV